MNDATLTAVILGNLLKTHIAGEIVSMLASGNVLPSLAVLGCPFRIRVYGDSKAELIENRKRCHDAAGVFGVGLKSRKQFASGATIMAVPFQNDPFNQIKHYFAEVTVTYVES